MAFLQQARDYQWQACFNLIGVVECCAIGILRGAKARFAVGLFARTERFAQSMQATAVPALDVAGL